MLRITTQANPESTTFVVEGRLTGPWVDELEQCWRKAAADGRGQAIVVDLTAVSFIDAAGRDLLASMYARGARFKTAGCLTKAIIDSIAQGARLAFRPAI